MKIVSFIALFFVSTFGLTACVPATTGYDSNYSSYGSASKDVVMTEKWFLTELNNASYQGSRITFEMSAENRVSGFSGCNRYFASVDILRGDQIKLGSVGSTRKLCADNNSNQLESEYLGILRGITHFNKSNSRLVLEGRSGNLVFYKKSRR